MLFVNLLKDRRAEHSFQAITQFIVINSASIIHGVFGQTESKSMNSITACSTSVLSVKLDFSIIMQD